MYDLQTETCTRVNTAIALCFLGAIYPQVRTATLAFISLPNSCADLKSSALASGQLTRRYSLNCNMSPSLTTAAFIAPIPLITSCPKPLNRSTATRPVGKRRPHATLAQPPVAPADPADFPILSEKVNDHTLVYLDSAATSQKPNAVIDAITDYYKGLNSNVHRGAHTLAARATDLFERTRDLLQRFINAPHREEIIYTRNATEAINLVASTWGYASLQPGDAIVVSVMEHHANLVPWQMIAAEKGATIIPLGLTSSQTYNLDDLRVALQDNNVKLVACSHVSNVLGCLNPVTEIVRLAHQHDALVLLDACQSVPHMPVDVQALGVDFLVASGHKMCGPTGAGFLWGRKKVLEEMPPYMGGGEMIADVFLEHSTYTELPHKFEAGTPAIGEIVGFGAAIEYLEAIGMDKVHRFEEEMGTYLYDRLTAFKEVTVYGPPPPRAALCAFNIEGVHSSDLATMLDLEGVAVRSGHHCAQPLHRELGVSSSARASLYIYNTKEEVDTFIEALKGAVDILGGTLTPASK